MPKHDVFAVSGGFTVIDPTWTAHVLHAAIRAMEDAGARGVHLDATHTGDTRLAAHAALVATWEGTLTVPQRHVLETLRRRRRDDPAHASEYTVVGVDASGRPVCQQPARFSARDGGAQTHRWAMLRNGDPTDVREPVTPLTTILREIATTTEEGE